MENRPKTVLVDTFDKNPFGLYNVHGNVWEWMEDCWHDSYLTTTVDNGPPSDGSAWTSDIDCNMRVIRSGSWAKPKELLRSASRTQGSVTARNTETGFRVAKSLP